MGTSKRRERERRARREAILQGASRVFSEKGFFDTTMQDIAEETELSVGTLYIYYKSKEELYLSLLFEAMDVFTKELQRIRTSTFEPRKKTKEMWDFFSEFKRQFPLYFKVLLLLGDKGFIDGISRPVIDEIVEKSTENFQVAAAIVQECIDLKLYREMNPREAVDLLWCGFIGLAQLSESRKNLGMREDSHSFERAFELLEKGLLKH